MPSACVETNKWCLLATFGQCRRMNGFFIDKIRGNTPTTAHNETGNISSILLHTALYVQREIFLSLIIVVYKNLIIIGPRPMQTQNMAEITMQRNTLRQMNDPILWANYIRLTYDFPRQINHFHWLLAIFLPMIHECLHGII